jgi:NADH:ubiquinone oxidoreductase subunit C
VDIKELIPKLKRQLPRAVLDSRPLGRSDELSVWIEMSSVKDVARALASDDECPLDWLEHLSVIEIDQALVVSYFLRSTQSGAALILRGSLLPKGAEDEVQADSVTEIWPMAEWFEAENSELFGVRFEGNPVRQKRLLPQDWQGFPLRKGYVFPAEFQGVPHMRTVGRTAPDEHGVMS